MLIYEYSTTHGAMPPNIYVLDLSAVRCGDRQARLSDLRCVSTDKEAKADFLYFRCSESFSGVIPTMIVLASPFAAAPGEQRIVVTASGKTSYLDESKFIEAMNKEKNRGEQDAPSNR